MIAAYKDIITIEAGKRGGQPCLRHMRITADDVLGYLDAGMTIEQILEDFPYLVKEDIVACQTYQASEGIK